MSAVKKKWSTVKNTDRIGKDGEESPKIFKDWNKKTYSLALCVKMTGGYDYGI